MKYHALFVIFEKVATFEIVFCCKLSVALYGLTFLNSFLACASFYHLLIMFANSLDSDLILSLISPIFFLSHNWGRAMFNTLSCMDESFQDYS